MKIDDIRTLVFRAAETGDWSKVPLDKNLMCLRNESGDTAFHVAAHCGMGHRVPRKLWDGFHLLDSTGTPAGEYLTAGDTYKMDIQNKQAHLEHALREQVRPDFN